MTKAARINRGSFDSEFLKAAAVPWKSDCKLAGKCIWLATLSMSEIAFPRAEREARLKETVTDGYCPWRLIVRASVVVCRWVNAFRGTAFAITEVVAVFEVVVVESALDGGVREAADGVYSTDVVVALDPAAAEAELEKDDTVLLPEAPLEMPDWR